MRIVVDVQAMSKAAGVLKGPIYTSAEGEETFAERLREAMAAADLSAADLARRVQEVIPDFSPGNISHYLAGRSTPRTNVLKAISRILDVDPAQLRAASNRSRASRKPSGADGPPSEDTAGDSPALSLKDLGDGDALLQINQKLPWPVALQILQMLKGNAP